jgi:Na+/H+ antiporter NhaD/arsenite permease-like protein
MLRAVIIFFAVYAGFIVSRNNRYLIAWAGVAVALALGALKLPEIVPSVSWNVIGIFAGTLVIAELFIVSKVPEMIADTLINRSPNLGFAFFSIMAFTSVLSMFIENVAAVLIVAPVALQLAHKAKVSPVPVMIGLAVTSNLQGTATLIGDPPSMILGAAMKMNFMDFIFYEMRGGSGTLKPGIFWFVQIGAVVGLGVLFLFFRGMRHKPERIPVTPVWSIVPSMLLVLMIVLLSLAAFFDRDFLWFGGTVCMAAALLGVVWFSVHDRRRAGEILRAFDWRTTAFLAGVFVLVGMLERRGIIEAFVGQLLALRGVSPFLLYSAVVWGSVAVSAFVDNVPYVTVMLPVVIRFARDLGLPSELFVFGLLIGSCLGGNITPIGASANIVAMGLLHRDGTPVSFLGFVRMGLPFTVAATGVAYLFLWFVYR